MRHHKMQRWNSVVARHCTTLSFDADIHTHIRTYIRTHTHTQCLILLINVPLFSVIA